jgi:hypothetical protein
MTVPFTFANQTGAIPLSELDANFAAVPNAANVAGTVTANAQPNITSVGTLTSLSVTGTTSTNLIFQRAPIISLGANAGFSSNIDFIAIGNSAAGNNNQQSYAIAIGSQAGFNNQGNHSISIGQLAGNSSQGSDSIALGQLAGTFNQSSNSIAIGRSAGNLSQGPYAVAIGAFAGNNNQGSNSVAIGSFAGYPSVANSAVVINGDTTPLDAPNSGLYISPIRSNNSSNVVFYNTTTKELTYSTAYGNANVAAYLPTYSGNLTSLNKVSALGNISGNYFIGDGSQLTGISAGNIVGSYSNANVAAYLPTYTGNVTANYFIGDGSQLTNVSAIQLTSGNNIVVTVGNTQSATFFTTGVSLPGNVTTGNVNSGNIISSANINLKAANLVNVTQSLFRLASFSTTQAANLTPQRGDMIFNNTLGNVQIYTGTKWGNIVVS